MKAIGAAFSSVSVLNASFRLSATDTGRISTTSAESSGVDLLKVRKAGPCGSPDRRFWWWWVVVHQWVQGSEEVRKGWHVKSSRGIVE